ncbi:MAG: GyrI-like domain-containing protein [archaeon]|nr:GyrI-like domain-containing protein [archaeon]
MEIKEKTIEEQKIAIINYKGSLKDMEILMSKLLTWIDVKEVDTEGELFAIFYNNPRTVNENEVVYDLGIPINKEQGEDLIDEDIYRIVDILEHKVLSGIHKGSLETIQESYTKMAEYSQENNYDIIGSPKEVYIKKYFEVEDENEIITEIQLPVIKM